MFHIDYTNPNFGRNADDSDIHSTSVEHCEKTTPYKSDKARKAKSIPAPIVPAAVVSILSQKPQLQEQTAIPPEEGKNFQTC